MSGHSKWHNIQARKGKQDAIRSNIFSKYAKQISIVTKTGGDKMDANFSLRLLVEKAKAAGMPKDNIDRAIKRGTGEINDGAQIEEALYEGYGANGIAVIIQTLSDNKNRTVSDLKHILSKRGGSLGNAGSVLWMFDQKGIIEISDEKFKATNLDKDDFELQMIDAGADDIVYEEGSVIIKTKMENYTKVLQKIKELNIEPNESGLQWIAKDKVVVDDEVRAKLEDLFEELEENDDVQDYFTNAE